MCLVKSNTFAKNEGRWPVVVESCVVQDDNSYTTTERTYGRYCSTVAMYPSARHSHHGPPVEPYQRGADGHDGAGDDGRARTLGRQRWQLSHHPALLRHRHPLGDTVLGVLSAPCVSSRGCLPPRGRRSPRHQSREEYPWPGSFLCELVRQARPRVGLLHPIARAGPGSALVSHACRARRAQRRGQSRQQGRSSTASKPPWKGRSKPVSTRRNCSTRSSHNR